MNIVSDYSLPAPNAPPAIRSINFSGENIILHGTNGVSGAGVYTLSSGNVALPFSNWTVLATNFFDADGNFNFTNPVHSNAVQFYLLQVL
jgi:hypothetical protein